MIHDLKKQILTLFAAGTLSCGTIVSFAQNKQDMAQIATDPAIASFYRDTAPAVYQMMVDARLHGSPMARQTGNQVNSKDMIHWDDSSRKNTEEIRLSYILAQAAANHASHFSFRLGNKDYAIPIANLVELEQRNKAYYPSAGFARESIDIVLSDSDDFYIGYERREEEFITSITTGYITRLPQSNIEAAIAHEARHAQETEEDLTADFDTRSNTSIQNEYEADKYMLQRAGFKNAISVLLTMAAYLNNHAGIQKSAPEQQALKEERRIKFGFSKATPDLNAHPTLGNRLLYLMALDKFHGNVPFPPPQELKPNIPGHQTHASQKP